MQPLYNSEYAKIVVNTQNLQCGTQRMRVNILAEICENADCGTASAAKRL